MSPFCLVSSACKIYRATHVVVLNSLQRVQNLEGEYLCDAAVSSVPFLPQLFLHK